MTFLLQEGRDVSVGDLSVCCKREDMSVDDLSVWCGREETHLLMTFLSVAGGKKMCLLMTFWLHEGRDISIDDLSVFRRGEETHLLMTFLSIAGRKRHVC